MIADDSRNRVTLRELEDEHHQQRDGIQRHHEVQGVANICPVFGNATYLEGNAQFDREGAVAIEEREDIPPLHGDSEYTRKRQKEKEPLPREGVITSRAFLASLADKLVSCCPRP